MYFRPGIWKYYCHIWNQCRRISLFRGRKKIPQFGTKNALFGYFWNHHFWNFPITKFCVRTKMLKFGTKNALFEYFWVGILKIYCHIWNLLPLLLLPQLIQWTFNYCHNILRIFDVWPNFPFTRSETKRDTYELPHELLSNLRLRILGN